MNENNLRKCKNCKLNKSLSEFSKEKRTYYVKKIKGEVTKYYYRSKCDVCTKERLEILSKRRNHKGINRPDGTLAWNRILTHIQKRAKDRGVNYSITKKDFKIWLTKQNHICSYCGYGLEEIKKLLFNYFSKGTIAESKRFQIDRKNNDKSIGYTLENICFACAICNSHKGDFYSHKEFKEIAQKYIVPKLKSVLRK